MKSVNISCSPTSHELWKYKHGEKFNINSEVETAPLINAWSYTNQIFVVDF